MFRSLLLLVMVTQAESRPALPMREVASCRIEFTLAVDTSPSAGRWGGEIAVYDAATDANGAVTNLTRRVIKGREHLPPRVRLEQLEECVRRWRFASASTYKLSLRGGPIFPGVWIVVITDGARAFTFTFPVTPQEKR